MDVLIYNSILYWITALYFQKKYGFCLLSFIWFYFAVFSTFGYLLTVDDIYCYIHDEVPVKHYHIEPYIYTYITFLAITVPLRRYNPFSIKVPIHIFNDRKILHTIEVCNYIAISYVMVKLIQIYFVASMGFGNMHDFDGDKIGILYPGAIGWILRPFNLIGRMNNMIVMPIIIFIVLKGYTCGYYNKSYTLKHVVPYILGTTLMGFVGGSRGAMFFGIMTVSYFYVLFFNSLDKKFKRKINISLLLIAVIVVFVVLNITFQRQSNSGTEMLAYYGILDYLGMMFPNIEYKIWGHVTHPMGARLFPSLVGTIPHDPDYWFDTCNIWGWLFPTLWGALYTEFGVIITMILVGSYYMVLRRYFKKKTYRIYDVPVVLFVYTFAFSSIFNLALTDSDYISFLLILLLVQYIKKTKSYYYE